MHGTTVKKT